MLASALWIVEYSLSKDDFEIREIGMAMEENLNACREGLLRDHQLIGLFYSKQSALLFIEGFKLSLTAKRKQDNNRGEDGLLYEDAVDFIKKLIDAQPYGFTKLLCKKAKLTYNTVISLLKNTLTYKTPELVMELLAALGYNVKIIRTMEMKAEEGEKSAETITYFISRKGEEPLNKGRS